MPPEIGALEDDGFGEVVSWRWSQGDDPLFITPEAVGLWTEHSDRSVLKTMMGGNEEYTNRLGRWRAEASDEFLRANRRLVESAPGGFATRMRSAPGLPDVADEEVVLCAMQRRLGEHAVGEEIIEDQIRRLRMCATAVATWPAPPTPKLGELWRT